MTHKLALPRNKRPAKSPARRTIERRLAQNAASRRPELPPAPWSHKLTMLTAVVLPLVGVVIGGVLAWRYGFMGWLNLGMLLAGWAITGTGITIGFHRLLTHRSFDTYRWVKLFWMTCGALSVEGSPLVWCAVHRRHHELSDQHGDPHSPHLHGTGLVDSLRGLWYAHTGWLFTGYWSSPDMQRYVPDLLADKALVAVDRLYYLWVLVSLALPAAIGGLFSTGELSWSWQGAFLGLLWGGLVRIWRRVAQQPPRLPHLGPPRPRLVAVRLELADHPRNGTRRPRLERPPAEREATGRQTARGVSAPPGGSGWSSQPRPAGG